VCPPPSRSCPRTRRCGAGFTRRGRSPGETILGPVRRSAAGLPGCRSG
jgi:hypothetical protein